MKPTTDLKTVLIIDDDPFFCRSIARILPLVGFRAIGTATGRGEALAIIEQAKPDVVMVDMNLGSSDDGASVAGALLAQHSVPIVYVSGALDERIVECVRRGRGHACLAKPFRLDEVGTALHVAIDLHGRELRTKQLMEALQRTSMRDELTGLLNRRGFFELGTQLLNVARRADKTATLFSIDLDGLKTINDTLGHAAGDRAIADAAALLACTFRSTDVVARLGGDEFVVLGLDADPASVVARLEEAAERFNAQGGPFRLAMSVGFALSAAGEDLAGLMARSDVAMYSDKRRRRAPRAAARPRRSAQLRVSSL